MLRRHLLTRLPALLLAGGLAQPASAATQACGIDFGDGGTHVIDFVCSVETGLSLVEIEGGTRVEVVAGGLLSGYGVYLGGGSSLYVDGGEVDSTEIVPYGASSVVMDGGSIHGWIYGDDLASSVVINGGTAPGIGSDGQLLRATITGGSIGSLSDGHFTVSGGVIGSIAWDVGSLTMTGGTVTESIQAYVGDAVISGGIFLGTSLQGDDLGSIVLHGTGFTIDGEPVPYGWVEVPGWDFNDDPVRLQGTPLDGGIYDFDAWPAPMTLFLVPEPGTAALLGVGLVGLGVRGRTRR